MYRNKKSLTIVLLILLAILILFVNKYKTNAPINSYGHVYEIVLGDNGFVPNRVHIKKGDTIKFTTTRPMPFWPASNLHPTHELYPAFDPKQPIPPSDTWSFTFERVGVWPFHDHLRPDLVGSIEVIN